MCLYIYISRHTCECTCSSPILEIKFLFYTCQKNYECAYVSKWAFFRRGNSEFKLLMEDLVGYFYCLLGVSGRYWYWYILAAITKWHIVGGL